MFRADLSLSMKHFKRSITNSELVVKKVKTIESAGKVSILVFAIVMEFCSSITL